MYKEKIKNPIKIPYKWSNNQIKNNFILSNDNKTIKIDYISCYNIYFMDYDFKEKVEYSFGIFINTFGKNLDNNYIGFRNEIENKSCVCCFSENSFYVDIFLETIFEGMNQYKINLTDRTKINLKFVLNLKNKTLDIKNYNTDISYKVINIKGNNFKFFVGKCNKGTIEYTILD